MESVGASKWLAFTEGALARRVSQGGKLIPSLCAVFNWAGWSGISGRGCGGIPHISGLFQRK